MRLQVAMVFGIVLLGSTALAAGERDAEWGRGVAAAIGSHDEPRVTRVVKDSPRGVAVRVLLPGLQVERARFVDAAAAQRYAQQLTIEEGVPMFIEVRAEQVVVLTGAHVDGRSAPELAAAAWSVLAGQREVGDIRTSWDEGTSLQTFSSSDSSSGTSASGATPVVVIDLDLEAQRVLGASRSLYTDHHARLLHVLEAAGARGVGFTVPVSLGEVTPATRAFVDAARATRLPIVVSERLVENTPAGKAKRGSFFDTGPTFRLVPAGADVAGEERIGRASQCVTPEILLPAETPRTYEELTAHAKIGDIMLLERTFAAGGPSAGLEPVAVSLLGRAGVLPEGWLASSGLYVEFCASASFYGTRGVVTQERLRGLRPDLSDPSSIMTFRYSDAVAGRVDPRVLHGAYVFVGSTDPEFGKASGAVHPGPVNQVNVYVHAFAARRLLAAVAAPRR